MLYVALRCYDSHHYHIVSYLTWYQSFVFRCAKIPQSCQFGFQGHPPFIKVRVEIELGEIPPHMEDHVPAMILEFNMQLQQVMQQFASQQAAYQVMLHKVQ